MDTQRPITCDTDFLGAHDQQGLQGALLRLTHNKFLKGLQIDGVVEAITLITLVDQLKREGGVFNLKTLEFPVHIYIRVSSSGILHHHNVEGGYASCTTTLSNQKNSRPTLTPIAKAHQRLPPS